MRLLKDPVVKRAGGRPEDKGAKESYEYALDKVILVFVGFMFATWILVGACVLFELTDWSKWEGWLGWGGEFAFVSVIPYFAKKVGQGIAKEAIT